MKMTNGQMADSIETLAGLEETGLLGFACAKNYRKLTAEAKEFLEEREKLLKKYGEPVDNGMWISPENRDAFLNEIVPYANIEVDVNVMTVPQDVFLSGKLTTKQMIVLDWMVEDTKDE